MVNGSRTETLVACGHVAELALHGVGFDISVADFAAAAAAAVLRMRCDRSLTAHLHLTPDTNTSAGSRRRYWKSFAIALEYSSSQMSTMTELMSRSAIGSHSGFACCCSDWN